MLLGRLHSATPLRTFAFVSLFAFFRFVLWRLLGSLRQRPALLTKSFASLSIDLLITLCLKDQIINSPRLWARLLSPRADIVGTVLPPVQPIHRPQCPCPSSGLRCGTFSS